MMEITLDRRVALTGCFNFRDLGGLPAAAGRTVRRGRLFRSDELHRLTPDDVETLAAIRLATLLDLRSHQEVTERSAALLLNRGVRHRHFPLTDAADDPARLQELATISMEDLYSRFLDERREIIRALFAALAEEPTYPAVVHCAAGKDRTGLVVALVLRTLGVPDDEIAADYALTDAAMTNLIAAMRAAGRADLLDHVPPHLLRAYPETMRAFLTRLDSGFGSTDRFLLDTGITPAEITQVRSLLLN